VTSDALRLYEPLQTAVQNSADRQYLLETSPEKLHAREESAPFQVTKAVADLAEQRTRRMVQERTPPLHDLLVALEAEAFAREQEQRERWNGMGISPPFPEMTYRPYVDVTTPIPDMPSDGKIRTPEDPNQKPPETYGLEISAPAEGAPVRAVAPGTVVHASELRGFRMLVIMEHADGLFSVYGHLQSSPVHMGQKVEAGDVIGKAGSIPHVNQPGVFFDVRRGRQPVATKELLGDREPAQLLFR